jgi:ABC-type polysaccharide/polyol phosphate export permease
MMDSVLTSAALASLYIQVISAAVILILYYTLDTHFVIDRPVGAVGMFLLAWASGIGVGMVFLAVKPWFPGFISIASTVYARANMIASGKMFLANTLPPKMLIMFSWNPLFHSIDQERGFMFINYTPHNSSISYPIYITVVLIMVGLMGEFYTRKHMSASWGAGR